jgi:two-component system, NarL family, nitrate/nitrite response regulator NarL
MTPLRVLVVANDPLARAGLAALLQSEDNITVVGQISPASSAVEAFTFDIALFDMGWELDDTLTPLADSPILELDTPLLVLIPDDEFVTEVVAALSGDSRRSPYGVLVRNTRTDRLVAALHATVEDLITLDPALAPAVMGGPAPNPLAQAPAEPLTPREREVLDLLAEGLPNKVIARRLTISEYTVKFHVNSILTKLNAGSRTEAVVRATRLGLITL